MIGNGLKTANVVAHVRRRIHLTDRIQEILAQIEEHLATNTCHGTLSCPQCQRLVWMIK